MKIDTVPGLTIHEHEGKLTGAFELPPADLAYITFDGRVMLTIVADVGAPFRVTTDPKDGTHRAHWTFKAVDAALVRDTGMRNHLASALYLDGADAVTPHPLDVTKPKDPGPTFEYPDDDGCPNDDDETPQNFSGETVYTEVERSEIELPHTPPRFMPPGHSGTVERIVPNDGIKRDPLLDDFLYDDRVSH